MRDRHSGSAALVALILALFTIADTAVAREGYRTFWRGQWVDYVEEGDFAVTDGDIIIGHKDAVREWRLIAERALAKGGLESAKALTLDNTGRLWQRAASGVVEVPYTVDAGNATTIASAVAEVNRVMAGVLQWVPRAAETDYVSFNLTASNSGACASSVGRVGGKQIISGDPECGVSTLVHEMGHALGLWHVQQDGAASAYVELRMDKMDPAKRNNNQPIFATRTQGGYDYSSIMHYGRTNFPISAERVTLETRPAGIDVNSFATYSPADVDALLRLYGAAPTRTTVTSNPAGLSLLVDGVAVTTPAVFDWPIGSVHRIWAPDSLQQKDGFTFAFGRWSHDPSLTPSRQLTWQVVAGDGGLGSPTSAPASTVLTANFVRLVNVSPTAAVQAGGTSTVTPRSTPWPGTASLYPQYSVFDLNAAPASGYQHYFTWGAAFASNGGAGLIPNLTLMISGSLATQTLGAQFHNGPALLVNAVGNGVVDGVSVAITPPGGTTSSSIAPRIARTTQGTWKFAMSSPQLIGSSIRHYFDSYDGFDNNTTGEVAMPSSGTRSVTINAHREVAPYKQVVPSCAGIISLSDSSTWLRTGSALNVSLGTLYGSAFTGWRGTLSGTATSASITVGTTVPEFVARFNTTAEPLALESVSPPVLGDDSTATTLTITGTGFTPQTMVSLGSTALAPTYVDARTLRVTVNRPALALAGRMALSATNLIAQGCAVVSNALPIDLLPVGNKVGVALTEYYHAALDYYFLTGDAGNKAILDGLADWRRTGGEIKLYAVPTVETVPLERHFFARVARAGTRGSHFFSALPADQLLFTSLNPTNAALDAKPYLEGIEGHTVPKLASGACPAGSSPVYRAYKGPPRYVDDGNHRFSASLAQHQDMVNRLGWTDEGVAFCGLN
ncbi:MAG: hypothetical protein JNL19_15330 [Burkholderiales bacterium]|nr:hypothetical protein [Burkholderiales bacterium]